MLRPFSVLLLLVPLPLGAQQAAQIPATEVQVASAVAPLPEPFRASATVLGYAEGRTGLVPLREANGEFICLADDPSDNRFHVACYHRDLEPFMARGRELRAQGHTQDVDTIRYAEIRAGTLAMPSHPAALYSMSGDSTAFDPATGAIRGANPLYVVYIPFATAESTGLSTQPVRDAPWLMSAGTPRAHIMFSPDMSGRAQAPPRAATADDETAVIAAAQAAFHAAHTGDTTRLAGMYAEDYVMIGPGGERRTRTERLAEVSRGGTHRAVARLTPLSVRIHGDVAVLFGRTEAWDVDPVREPDLRHDSPPPARPPQRTYSFTQVFTRQDGEWKLSSTQVAQAGGAL